MISADFFSILGVTPMIGHDFSAQDYHRLPGEQYREIADAHRQWHTCRILLEQGFRSAFRFGEPDSCAVLVQIKAPELRVPLQELDTDLNFSPRDSARPHDQASSASVLTLDNERATWLHPLAQRADFGAELSSLIHFFRRRTTSFAFNAWWRGRLDEADTAARKGLELDPQFPGCTCY
jgi:hypothetical protein